jgi:hypothetical protein
MGSCVRPRISLCSAPRGKQYSSNRSTEDDEEDEEEDEEEEDDEDDEDEEDSRGIASSSSVPPTAMR